MAAAANDQNVGRLGKDLPPVFQAIYGRIPNTIYGTRDMSPAELKDIRSIYISVGEKESGNMLKGFADLRDCLKEKNIPSLDMHTQLILDEGHRSAALPAYYMAFKYLYEKK